MAWTCQRVVMGIKCGHVNENRHQLCRGCAMSRPPKRKPAHMAALDRSYAEFIVINGGEHCGICGAKPKPGKVLRRDHDHRTGKPRGLLCYRDNRFLASWMDAEWLRAALRYSAAMKRCLRCHGTGRGGHRYGQPVTGLCPACDGNGELPDIHEWASYEARYDYRDGRVRVVRDHRGKDK